LDVTAALARFICESDWQAIGPRVRHEARRSLLNCLGAALGGCRDAAVEHAIAALAPFSGPPQASLVGRAERLDALSAAFVNGAAANVLDFDDTHLPTVIHPAAPVVPALLAFSEMQPFKGEAFLHALILGIEVECRIGNAITPWHYARGWHITSTCGVIGAAAAAARLMRLDEPRTAAALGIAANQACGVIESLGTMAKSVSVGSAPRNGLFAALLAARGFTAAPQTLEGERGFLRVFGEKPDLAAVTKNLGTDWESARNTYKPYPCGIVLHPVIDALFQLKGSHSLELGDVKSVSIRGHPLLRQRTDRRRPASGREAQVSAQHAAAVCIAYGEAGIGQFSDACAAEPALQAFGERVTIVDDASMPVEAAAVELQLTDGRRLRAEVRDALGSAARPMSDAQLEAKVRSLAAHGAPGCDADRLIEQVWALEALGDAVAIARLAT
jgi:2-methylcitrate dehydratase PrpD